MKRLFKRLSWLTMVIVVGSIAIAQAQRSTTVSPLLSGSGDAPTDGDHAADLQPVEGENSIPAAFGPFTEHRALPGEGDNLAGSPTLEVESEPADALSPSSASAASAEGSTPPYADSPAYSASDVPDVESEPEPRFMRARRNAAAATEAQAPAAQGVIPSGDHSGFSPLAADPQEPRRISESAGDIEPTPLPNSGADPFTDERDPAPSEQPGSGRATTREANAFNAGRARIGLARRDVSPTDEMPREPRTLAPEATSDANETFGDSFPPSENGLPGNEPSLPVRSEEGTGLPGPVDYEGLQTPTLAVEKFAPAEIQMGQSALFEIRVRNASSTTVHNVRVLDEIPQGTRLMSTTP